MGLLNPILFGLGLGCVAIPILIHLLMRRRRKPVRWAAMRFLEEAWRRQRRRLRLERWLLLAARCLLVALLAVAFGRPILRAAGLAGVRGPKTVHVVIDDSLVSALEGEGGRRAIDRHKDRAKALLATLDGSRGDRVSLLTLATPAEALVFPPSSDLGAVSRAIDALTPRASRGDFAGALAALGEEINEEPSPASVVVFTDWRGPSVPAAPAPVLPEVWSVVASRPAVAPASNMGVLAVTPTRRVLIGRGALDAPVRVRVRRSGDVDAPESAPVVLTLEGDRATTVGQGAVRFEAGQREASVTIGVDASALRAAEGRVVLRASVGSDALPRDDQRRAVVTIRDELSVGIAGVRRFGSAPSVREFQGADWLRVALAPTEDALRRATGGIEASEVDPSAIERASLDALDAIWVTRPDRVSDEGWTRLGRFASDGNLVVVTAAPSTGPQGWTEAFVRALMPGVTIDREPKEFDGGSLQLPRVTPEQLPLLDLLRAELDDLARSVSVEWALAVRAGEGCETLVELEDGTPWIIAARPTDVGGSRERGAVVLIGSAIDLEWTDLAARALMVPLVQEITRQGVGLAGEGREVVAGAPAALRGGEVALVAQDGRQVSRTGSESRGLRDAGVLRAVDPRGATRGLVIVNPDAEAGRTDPTTPEEAQAWLERAAPDRVFWLGDEPGDAGEDEAIEAAVAGDSGGVLTVWALVLAIVVALVEVVLARVFSHADQAPAKAK